MAGRRGAPQPLRVLMLNPPYVVGRRNSDIRTYSMLQNLGDEQRLTLSMCDSRVLAVQANASYAFAAAFWRSRLSANSDTLARVWHLARRCVWLPRGVIRAARADVVYTLLLFPVNDPGVPIVLDFDFNAWGIAPLRRAVDRMWYIPRWMVERAAVVAVRHEVSLSAFHERFPDLAHKGIVVPSPLPGCEALDAPAISAKFAAFGRPAVKVLFVGNAPRETGLPELVQAYRELAPRFPLELTIVSRFADGPVQLPPEVRVLSDIPPPGSIA